MYQFAVSNSPRSNDYTISQSNGQLFAQSISPTKNSKTKATLKLDAKPKKQEKPNNRHSEKAGLSFLGSAGFALAGCALMPAGVLTSISELLDGNFNLNKTQFVTGLGLGAFINSGAAFINGLDETGEAWSDFRSK